MNIFIYKTRSKDDFLKNVLHFKYLNTICQIYLYLLFNKTKHMQIHIYLNRLLNLPCSCRK